MPVLYIAEYMVKKPFIIIIYGPTAVGKTDFAVQLASSLPAAEIVNMDVGQLYTPLTIGTAKPDWRNSNVLHHLFDYIAAPVNITAFRYRELVKEKIDSIHRRGTIPLLVGGSGFYLKSLLFAPLAHTPNSNNEQSVNIVSDSGFWEQLRAIDPLRAQKLHPNDTYRIQRALTIWKTTGMLPSAQKPIYNPIAPFCIIHLTRERTQLYERINKRVHMMIDEGWIDEVKQLQGTPWEPFLYKKKLIGYDDIFDYLAGEHTPERLNRTIAHIQKKSRHYAKRQETMWRGIAAEILRVEKTCIDEANLTFIDLELYIKQLLKRIMQSM